MSDEIDMLEAHEDEALRRRLERTRCADCGLTSGLHTNPDCPGYDNTQEDSEE